MYVYGRILVQNAVFICISVCLIADELEVTQVNGFAINIYATIPNMGQWLNSIIAEVPLQEFINDIA